jgi:hypothetical protein
LAPHSRTRKLGREEPRRGLVDAVEAAISALWLSAMLEASSVKGFVLPVVWRGVGIRARGVSVYIGGRPPSASEGFVAVGSAVAAAILGFR